MIVESSGYGVMLPHLMIALFHALFAATRSALKPLSTSWIGSVIAMRWTQLRQLVRGIADKLLERAGVELFSKPEEP